MNEMYKRIEALCVDRGISVTKMCKDAKVSRAPLTELKMNRTQKLSVENLEKIAAFFGVSMSYFLGAEIKKAPSEDGVSEKDVRLIEWFRSLPPEKQRAILTAQDAPEGIV